MEQSTLLFASWFTNNGGYLHPSLEIARGQTGNCLRVKSGSDPIERGSQVISCPKRSMVSFTAAKSSLLLNIINERAPSRIGNEIISLRFYLVEQYLLGRDSFWWPYIQSLPQPNDLNGLNTTLYFNQVDFRWLHGTNLGAATLGRRELWQQEFQEALGLLKAGSTAYKWDAWTWDLYLWATTIITSRSFPVASYFSPDVDIPALVPGLDLLNHSPNAEVEWDLGAEKYSIKVAEPISAGCEILNNYGPKSNEELLIGYGFCLPENPNDSFGLGFNAVISKRIQAVKEARGTSILQKAAPTDNKGEDENDARVSEQHGVWLKKHTTSDGNTNNELSYEFSSYFLEHSSIAVENDREQRGHRSDWAGPQTQLTTASMSRNKLHVLATTTMLLEKSMLEIRNSNLGLGKPANQRQSMAAMYRHEQLGILEYVIARLHENLRELLNKASDNGVLRLQQILNTGLPILTKDLRSLVHVALGTRNEVKIRERGGEECVFALWLCGLWTLQQSGNIDRTSPLARQCISWLELLQHWYGPPSQATPPSSANGSSQANEIAALAASYLEAIRLTLQKHPQSLYSSPLVTLPLLAWCLNIVRSESVRLPDPFVGVDQEEDEYVLFIESTA